MRRRVRWLLDWDLQRAVCGREQQRGLVGRLRRVDILVQRKRLLLVVVLEVMVVVEWLLRVVMVRVETLLLGRIGGSRIGGDGLQHLAWRALTLSRCQSLLARLPAADRRTMRFDAMGIAVMTLAFTRLSLSFSPLDSRKISHRATQADAGLLFAWALLSLLDAL